MGAGAIREERAGAIISADREIGRLAGRQIGRSGDRQIGLFLLVVFLFFWTCHFAKKSAKIGLTLTQLNSNTNLPPNLKILTVM